MFERFTDRARRVVVLAQEEARAMRHHHIGTEHVLLSLIRESDDHGVDLETVREFVRREAGVGDVSPGDAHLPFTPRMKKVLELSLREALQLRHAHISSEHLLLGLLREGQGRGVRALEASGADLTAIRRRVLDRLSREQRPRETTEDPDIVQRLAKIQESLDRIERHLGIKPSD